ncbi:MAG: molybdate ABC transporter substrate-binding protein [Pseudomonadota bacterium]
MKRFATTQFMLRVVMILFLLLCFPAHSSERLLVFAAASQNEALVEIGKKYEQICNCEVVFSFAATSTLARQIDAGAAADVFISASDAWANWLVKRIGENRTSRSVIAGNRLVIASAVKTRDSFNILWRGRFAMADPQSVPAGIYGREALQSMGIWEKVRPNAVYAENVRVALASTLRQDLMAAIVYQSDLHLANGLHAHYVFPKETHSAINYVAVTTDERQDGKNFVNFLRTIEVQELFERFGFLPVSATNQE